MPAYVLVQITVRDPAVYARYKELAPASIAAFGGRYLVRGGEVDTLEGKWSPARLVVLEFPDVATAKAWRESAEYAPALRLRQLSADTEMILVDGVAERAMP